MDYHFRVLDHKRKQEMSNLLSTTVPYKKQCLPSENHAATEIVDGMSNGIPQIPNSLSASMSQNSINTTHSGTFNMNITFVSNDLKRA